MATDYLCHYGVLGMKWGVRRYQNYDGSLTSKGRSHYGIEKRKSNPVEKINAQKEKLTDESKAWLKNATGAEIKEETNTKGDSKKRHAIEAAALAASAAVAVGAHELLKDVNIHTKYGDIPLGSVIPAMIMSMSITAIGTHELTRGKTLSTKFGDVKLGTVVPVVSSIAAGITTGAAVTGLHAAKNAYNFKKGEDSRIGNEYDRDYSIGKNTVLQTLSANPNRTKDAEFFYASFTENDKDWYKAKFSRVMKNKIDTIVPQYKANISNKTASDIKVASEKTGISTMSNLYNNDSDFRDFLTNPERLKKVFPEKTNKKAYKEAASVLDSINAKGSATNEELKTIYKLFNYVLPNDGRGDTEVGADIAKQRKKFLNALKDDGYGAVIDTNDSYYGNYAKRVQSAVIVFDMDNVVPDSVKNLTMSEVNGAEASSKINFWKRVLSNQQLSI